MIALAHRLLSAPIVSAVSLIAIENVAPEKKNLIVKFGIEIGKAGLLAGMFYSSLNIPAPIKSMANREVEALIYVMAQSVRVAIETGSAAINLASAYTIIHRLITR